jgi:glycine cleavage system aminomethyltransferase T
MHPRHYGLKNFYLNGGHCFSITQCAAYCGMDPIDENSFKRINWHGPVGAECKAVREEVGVLNLSGFAKFEVSGPGAEHY